MVVSLLLCQVTNVFIGFIVKFSVLSFVFCFFVFSVSFINQVPIIVIRLTVTLKRFIIKYS